MTSIETFETALKDVLKAKRISQSKMATLTEIALKCMDNDVQMVSLLYRIQKGLSPSAKGSNLYAIDALARAARNRVVKQNITGDLNSGRGNCATFLLRIEGILDGLFQDLLSTHSDELKEKAKKILDIWTKQNTFPSAVLSPLCSLLKDAENDKETDKAHSTDVAPTEPASAPSFPTSMQPATSQPPAAAPIDVDTVQSTLLALLSKAANTFGTAAPNQTQTAPNIAPVPPAAPAPVLDANQLALLQQLAQTAKGNAVPSQPVPVPASVVPSLTTPNAVPVVPPVQGPPQSQPYPYRDDHYGAPAPHRESEHDRFNGPERGYPRDNYNDPRRGFRGGGGPRDHGRGGGRGRGRWDDREHFRDRSREFSRDPRTRRSRSRSPPGRYGGHGGPGPRDARPYSPPRRGGYSPYAQRSSQGYGSPADGRSRPAPEPGKDEFGRDLRADSPDHSDAAPAQAHERRSASPLPPGTGSMTTSDRGSVLSENADPAARASAGAPSYPQPHSEPSQYQSSYSAPPTSPPSSISPSTSAAPPASPPQHRMPGGVGLEGFDRASFDPSQPASWEALGKAWAATHGAMPTHEELMQFVLGSAPLAPPHGSNSYDAPAPQQAPPGPYGTPTPQQAASPYGASASQSESQSPAQHTPPQQQYSQYSQQEYGDRTQWQGQGQDRQWNRPQGPRGDWRGDWRGGRGGARGGDNFGGRGRGYGHGRGRGDFGRGGGGGGYGGRGEFGRRGFDREDQGRGQYGYGNGNGRGAYNAGGRGGYQPHEQETDAVMLSGGDDQHSWQEQQGYQGAPYGGQPQQAWQGQGHPQPRVPVQSFQPQMQNQQQPPHMYDPTPSQPAQEGEGGGSVGSGGGGSAPGRMQKVGDKWVFVRGAA
ncbi:hypothetical protein BV20DRAFT_34029 [Pilatotrama ljubarskyi]|nr:hypothetical protein BV20DRAFT_34029 [Pilatotrama ljubarskyi]